MILKRETKIDLTMDELYGDSSQHQACQLCGFCIDCRDCENFGCGAVAYEEGNAQKFKTGINHRGKSET